MSTTHKLKKLQGVEYFPISSIIVNREERLRRSEKEIAANAQQIADSLILVGPISALVLTEDNILIAGECRLEAYKLLGQTEVPVVRRVKLERAMALMIELDENMRRTKMTWQDIVLGIAAVHNHESKMAAERKEQWGMRATGALVKASHSYVNDCLVIAKLLERTGPKRDSEIWEAKNLEDAKKIVLFRKEQAAMAAKAKLSSGAIIVPQAPKATKPTGIISITLGNTEVPIVESATPAEIASFKQIKLSDRLFNEDCIKVMNEILPESCVDVIVTDIPYGIDMDLMEDMQGIDQMRSTHDVEQNVELMKPFLQGAYRVLKDDTYLFFFFAPQHQEKLSTWGREVGFTVLDWNLLWIKPHSCKNNAPHQNHTKSYEPVMVMKKGKPRLAKPMNVCHMVVDGMPDKRLQSNPFAKPLEFVDTMIMEPIHRPGLIMYDPFAGAGSIVRAALLKGWKVIASEIDKDRFPELENRIKDCYRNMLGKDINFI